MSLSRNPLICLSHDNFAQFNLFKARTRRTSFPSVHRQMQIRSWLWANPKMSSLLDHLSSEWKLPLPLSVRMNLRVNKIFTFTDYSNNTWHSMGSTKYSVNFLPFETLFNASGSTKSCLKASLENKRYYFSY